MSSPLLMRTPLPREVIRLLRAEGHDPQPLLARFRLPDNTETAANIVVPLHSLIAFYERAALQLRDPALGLHLVDHMPQGAYGLVEFSLISAPTLRAVLLRLSRYVQVMNELTTLRVVEDAAVVRCEMTVPGSAVGLGRHANEFFIALLIARAKALTSAAFVPTRVWFAHSRPADLREHIRVLHTTALEFDQPTSGVAFSAQYLDVPLPHANPALMEAIDQHVDAYLTPAAPSLQAAVQAAIREHLASGAPTIEDVAGRIGMSARTLQRRLVELGTGYQRLLDEVRQDLARTYLGSHLAPVEIAYLLGYSEMPAFRRAFKRWTGKTPEAWKREHG